MYDIAIIGAGPGGFSAAVNAVCRGLKVCVIEKELIGGVCLNWGCIPTKTIVRSINLLRDIKKASDFGIDIKACSIDIKNVITHKDDVVSRLRNGAEGVLKSKGVDIIRGTASFKDKNTLNVDGKAIEAKNIIIATGSTTLELEGLKLNRKSIVSSKEMLKLDEPPKSLVVIGGGVIGCEFASIYHQLGTEVTIIELMDQLLPSGDREIARRLESAYKKIGINILKKTKVIAIKGTDSAEVELGNGNKIKADKALLCIGRKPNIEGLGIEKIGIEKEKGRILVDEHLKTNIPNIYAIGDVIGGYQLAHVATYEGTVATENISGNSVKADYCSVPACVYSYPEVSSVGIKEEEAESEVIVTKLPFSAISKAHILGETDGIIKLISDKKSGRVLGAYIIGPIAGELISNFGIAIKKGLTVDGLSDVIYAHPSLSEGILEITQRAKSRP